MLVFEGAIDFVTFDKRKFQENISEIRNKSPLLDTIEMLSKIGNNFYENIDEAEDIRRKYEME